MAYSVARELHIRPYSILTEWSCEELLVAWGIYANRQSQQYFESLPSKERAAKGMSNIDRWSVPFFTEEQVHEINSRPQPSSNDLEAGLAAMQQVNDVIMGR